MLLGFVLVIYDNKCNMYKKLELNECDKYKDTYTINRIDPTIKIKTKRAFSSTYDNLTIVTEQVKSFCTNEGYEGLEFIELPNSPGFYWFKIHNIIEFDAEAYGTRFINYNKQCEGYEEIIGATPACLKVKEEIRDGFFRTDISFGSFATKAPLEIIGPMTKEKLKASGFTGIDYNEIYDKYDWQK
ncbi:hypothetical protein [Pedobacter sp.]|jgi:hypothetical protein|uniref:hypothetical protein n=1 Tax=Pedobacter sp. TaxID=1411316 RepID=UPI002D7FC545|nr:hypothetical protein [Pedobacter sp.]